MYSEKFSPSVLPLVIVFFVILQAIGVTPNVYTYNAAITACGKAGRYAQAVALLRQMPAVGVTPDEVCMCVG